MTTTPVNPEPPRRGDQCICLGFDGSDVDDWTVLAAETLDGFSFTPRFCQDPAVDRLRDLIADGIDQVTASHLIWPPTTRTGVPEWSG